MGHFFKNDLIFLTISVSTSYQDDDDDYERHEDLSVGATKSVVFI